MSQDKINAYMTLYTALVTVAKAAAPMIPFMADDIYRNLVCSVDKNAPISVHLCSFPEVNEAQIDTQLEDTMEELLKIVVLGRAARNGSNIKNRQPVAKMYVKAPEKLDEFFTEIVRDELNLKEVIFCDDVSDFMTFSFKPQLKTLGPKYGKQIGEIRNALAGIDGSAAKKELDDTGFVTLSLSTGDIKLEKDDLLIEIIQKDGFFTVSEQDTTVALDTCLTPELIEEGFVREVISKVQQMRKEADFNVMDHITVYCSGNEKIEGIIKHNEAAIGHDVLCDSFRFDEVKGFTKSWDINGEKVELGVEKI